MAVIANCVYVRASGINSLHPRRREVICRVTYTQHVTTFSVHSLPALIRTAPYNVEPETAFCSLTIEPAVTWLTEIPNMLYIYFWLCNTIRTTVEQSTFEELTSG
jgi:hypothetical protein